MKLWRYAVRQFLALVEDGIRNIGGDLGFRLRRAYYRRRLKRCGRNLAIAPNVRILNPEYMQFGDHASIDSGSVLIAGPKVSHGRVKQSKPNRQDCPEGMLVVGDRCHLGLGVIVQAHGGVKIGDGFTMSSDSKIYSFSNDWRQCRNGTIQADGLIVFYVLTPVTIGDNVWLGLGATVVGAELGCDCFVRAGSVACGSYPDNCVIGGNPAKVEGSRFSDN